jgi:hypothetical protein
MASSGKNPEMPLRELGSTGEKVSAIGLGGWHLGTSTVDEALAIRIIRTAVDGGINFLDNSWDYNDGASETRMGKALGDGYRRKAFLMTKMTVAPEKKRLDSSKSLFADSGPTASIWSSITRSSAMKTLTASSIRRAPTLPFSRRARQGSCATSGLPGTRTRGFTCRCSPSPRNADLNSMPSRCP